MGQHEGIDHEVITFIHGHIDSVEGLEVLLHMRAHEGESWTAESLSQTLRTDANSVQARLTRFESLGLVTSSASGPGPKAYHYQPKTPLVRQAVEAVAVAYNQRRVRVIDAIFSRPIDRIQVFADAFKLRKD